MEREAMKATKKVLTAADLFCGGGGFTTGAQQAGVDVVLAVNHWRTAIFTHQHNHPTTRHICARIDDIDPRHDRTIPELDILLASPECTHHSIARGGKPIDDQKRATPFHVCIWADAKHPSHILVENVREFRDWGPLRQKRDKKTGKLLFQKDGSPWMEADPKRKGETFRQWIRVIESIGYKIDHELLNAADYGAATKRIRLFIHAVRDDVFQKRGRTIAWPEPTHAGRWLPAYSVIDWQKPCPSIFGRKRPLAEKTLRRIEIGLRKFVGGSADPFIVKLRFSRSGLGQTVSGIADPIGTVTAGGLHHALAVPFQFKAIGNNPGLTLGIDQPVRTIVANQANEAIVVPYMLNYHGGTDPSRDGTERACGISEPVPVIPTENRYGVVMPFMQTLTHGGRERSLLMPAPTITTANRGEHAIVMPFLTKYYGTAGAEAIDEPLDTVTTKDRFGLCAAWLFGDSFPPEIGGDISPAMESLLRTMRELRVFDIGFRMLDVNELAHAQGFPDSYYLHGTRGEQVRQVGNAVCPPVAKALCQTITEAA